MIGTLQSVAESVKGFLHIVFAGSQALLKKVWGGIKEIIKSFTYDRERDKWKVTTTEREIPPDKVEEEVPDYIRAKVEREQNREHDVTDEVDMIERKKTAAGKETYEDFMPAFMRFLKELFRKLWPSCTFEEFLEETGEYFDGIMRQEEAKNNGKKCPGGKITFTLSGDKVEIESKLYFFDSDGDKWTIQTSRNTVDKSRFNDWDKDADLLRLSRGETVELDITPSE